MTFKCKNCGAEFPETAKGRKQAEEHANEEFTKLYGNPGTAIQVGSGKAGKVTRVPPKTTLSRTEKIVSAIDSFGEKSRRTIDSAQQISRAIDRNFNFDAIFDNVLGDDLGAELWGTPKKRKSQ